MSFLHLLNKQLAFFLDIDYFGFLTVEQNMVYASEYFESSVVMA